jgi:hypothetical protein
MISQSHARIDGLTWTLDSSPEHVNKKSYVASELSKPHHSWPYMLARDQITRTFYPLSLLPYTVVPSLPLSHQERKNLSNQEY